MEGFDWNNLGRKNTLDFHIFGALGIHLPDSTSWQSKVRSIFLHRGSKELKMLAWHLAVAMNICIVRGQEKDGREHLDESRLQAGITCDVVLNLLSLSSNTRG